MSVLEILGTYIFIAGACGWIRITTTPITLNVERYTGETPREIVFRGPALILFDFLTAPFWAVWNIGKGLVRFAIWLYRNEPIQ